MYSCPANLNKLFLLMHLTDTRILVSGFYLIFNLLKRKEIIEII